MNLEIFAIRDQQLDAFMQPWTAQSKGQAIRMFTDEVNNPDGQMNKHAEDYSLYHLGNFTQKDGRVHPHESGPQQLELGKNVKRP